MTVSYIYERKSLIIMYEFVKKLMRKAKKTKLNVKFEGWNDLKLEVVV